MNNEKAINPITEGSIIKALLAFFFPILFGTFFQQLYNTIDAVIVGHFVGKDALAAVGGGTAVFVNLVVGFFMGLTSGGSVLISQLYGSKEKDKLNSAISTSMAMSFIGGILMTAIALGSTGFILGLTKTPTEIIDLSAIYLRVYFTGLVPMFIYNMSSAIFRAVGNSRTPLIILIISCGCNILLDLVFVIFLKMGVTGVALATVLCQIISAIISICLLVLKKNDFSFSLKKLKFNGRILGQILRIGIPCGIQSMVYTISNLIIQTNINSFGTDSVAAWAAYGKIDGVFWMTINSFGIAITTFSGQNFGAGKIQRIRKATGITFALAGSVTAVISVLFMLGGKYLYYLFTKDPEVIQIGTQMLNFLVPFYIVYISIEILSGTIRGTGQSFVPTIISVLGICGLRLIWLFIFVPRNCNIYTVMLSYPITWAITSIAFWIYYFILLVKRNGK